MDKRSCEGVDVTCRHLIGCVLGAQHGCRHDVDTPSCPLEMVEEVATESWLRRLQPNPVWDSLDLARLARHPLNDTSPETPPCNHHSNFSETETYFHAARHSSFLMEPGPTSNTGGHERQREQTRSTRRSMALTTSQRGDLYMIQMDLMTEVDRDQGVEGWEA